MADTIYALATPPGRSGVAIIRISGSDAFEFAESLTKKKLTPRYAHFSELRNSNNELLDHAVVIGFKAPASFTGEDVVELQTHGSRAGIQAVSGAIDSLGARLAEPGEFTRRALENGKLDMLQVEALADFIDSDTEIQRKQSLKGYLGRNSEWVETLRSDLVEVMSLIALSIDFSDEELPENLLDQVKSQLFDLKKLLFEELQRSKRSVGLREGFRVAIIGEPNVGKSTLLNAISGRDIAIATEIPGTTRDIIEAFVDLDGLPVIFLDTAGIRKAEDQIEKIGVARARDAAELADLRILLISDESDRSQFSDLIKPSDLVLRSKSDLHGGEGISARTGEGVDALLDQVKSYFMSITQEPGLFRHQRQIETLAQAAASLDLAYDSALLGEVHFEIVAEYVRGAVASLDYLVGRVGVEDMLDVIFSQFCIGK